MLIGATLAVIVLLVFLRHGRITAISATSIPLTLAITVFVMSLIGQDVQSHDARAMAIAIGLVIDDAVVITENIARHLRLTNDRLQAIRAAVQELIWPVTTSTLTTVVVFLPLGLLQGVVGQFFAALATTLTGGRPGVAGARPHDHPAARRAVRDCARSRIHHRRAVGPRAAGARHTGIALRASPRRGAAPYEANRRCCGGPDGGGHRAHAPRGNRFPA